MVNSVPAVKRESAEFREPVLLILLALLLPLFEFSLPLKMMPFGNSALVGTNRLLITSLLRCAWSWDRCFTYCDLDSNVSILPMFEYTGGGVEGGCGGAIVFCRFAAWLRQFSLWLCTSRPPRDIQAIHLRRPLVGLHLPRGRTGYDNTACAIAISHK